MKMGSKRKSAALPASFSFFFPLLPSSSAASPRDFFEPSDSAGTLSGFGLGSQELPAAIVS